MSTAKLLEALGLPGLAAEESVPDGRILDAALVLVAEIGERHLTMDAVAATAKVGRRTVFRRFGSRDALLQRLYHREVSRAVEHIAPHDMEAVDLIGALTAAFLRLVDYATSHPVIVRLARAEPETLVKLWRTGNPSGHDMAVLLLRSVPDRVDHDARPRDLTCGCEMLARLLFAEQLLPGSATTFAARDGDAVRAVLTSLVFPDRQREGRR